MRVRTSFLLLALGLFALGLVLSLPLRGGGEEVAFRPYRLEAPELALVLAARDVEYCAPYTPCGPGKRTDTIFYLRAQRGRVAALAIPRDLYVPFLGGKINAAYARGGGELLRRAVEEVTGLVADRYVVVTLDSIARVIDALGGVDVRLEVPMRYVDRAANLYIDFPAGDLHLNGEEAVRYMRFRHDALGDYARVERIKAVLAQLFKKAKDPRTWPALAGALVGVWEELDTDLSLSEVLDRLPAIRGFSDLALATLPTREGQGTFLLVDEEAKARLLAELFQTSPPLTPPEGPVRVRGPSEWLGWARAFLEREGLEATYEEATPQESRILAREPSLGAYLGDLFHLPVVVPPWPLPETVVELGPDLLH